MVLSRNSIGSVVIEFCGTNGIGAPNLSLDFGSFQMVKAATYLPTYLPFLTLPQVKGIE